MKTNWPHIECCVVQGWVHGDSSYCSLSFWLLSLFERSHYANTNKRRGEEYEDKEAKRRKKHTKRRILGLRKREIGREAEEMKLVVFK